MAKTYKELKSSANKIKIEEVPLANTAGRLGAHLEDVVDTVDEDITLIKKDYTQKSEMLVISNANPTTSPTLNGQFHYNDPEGRMFIAVNPLLSKIEGRSLLGTAPASWKIRYDKNSGEVSSFEQDGSPLLRSSSEQIIDINELEATYDGVIPEDREGYKRTLYYGVEPNDTEVATLEMRSPTLYAAYAVAGWLEVASQKKVDSLEAQYRTMNSMYILSVPGEIRTTGAGFNILDYTYVHGSDYIEFYIYGVSAALGNITFFDANKEFMYSQSIIIDTISRFKMCVPEAAYYCRTSEYTAIEGIPLQKNTIVNIDKSKYKRSKFIDTSNIINGTYSPNDVGIVGAQPSYTNNIPNYVETELIPTEYGDAWLANLGTTKAGFWLLFDENKTLLAYNNTLPDSRLVNLPNAKYISFLLSAPNMGEMRIIKSTDYNGVISDTWIKKSKYQDIDPNQAKDFAKIKTSTNVYNVELEFGPVLEYINNPTIKGSIESFTGKILPNDRFELGKYTDILGASAIKVSPASGDISSVVGFYRNDYSPISSAANHFDFYSPFISNVSVTFIVPDEAAFFLMYASSTAGAVYDNNYSLSYTSIESVDKIMLGQYNLRYRYSMIGGSVVYTPDVIPAYAVSEHIAIPKGMSTLVYSKNESLQTTESNYNTTTYFYGEDGTFIGDVGGDTLINYEKSLIIPLGATYFTVYNSVSTDGTNFNRYPLQYTFATGDRIIPGEENSIVFNIDENNRAIYKKIAELDVPIPPYEDYTPALIKFKAPVNISRLVNTPGSVDISDSLDMSFDWGMLRLPSNYTAGGTPVPLIISCHGAGGLVNGTSGSIDVNTHRGILIRMGYAVMDMNGLPTAYAGRESELHYGCPITLQCYVAGYNYVMEHYNLKKDGCFVEGASMGGMSSLQLAVCPQIPCMAYAGFCPAMDTFKQPFMNSWDGIRARTEIPALFGFENRAPVVGSIPSEAEIQMFKNNMDKVLGYYPIFKTLTSGKVMTLFDTIPSNSADSDPAESAIYEEFIMKFPVPLKIWHNTDDTVVRARYSRYLCRSIRNGGGIAYLHEMPTGGHNAWDNGPKTNVLIDLDGNEFLVSTSVYEKALWYRRWI